MNEQTEVREWDDLSVEEQLEVIARLDESLKDVSDFFVKELDKLFESFETSGGDLSLEEVVAELC